MTGEELTAIANARGYGTGQAARDKMAAENEALALLPEPSLTNAVAAGTSEGASQLPMCSFGFSPEDGKDWSIYYDASDSDFWAFGSDARDDAKTVAAIINAYRMGLIARVK